MRDNHASRSNLSTSQRVFAPGLANPTRAQDVARAASLSHFPEGRAIVPSADVDLNSFGGARSQALQGFQDLLRMLHEDHIEA